MGSVQRVQVPVNGSSWQVTGWNDTASIDFIPQKICCIRLYPPL
ncbi:hypothetical protein RIEGSTA812A_PEG_669 [invertebrate metagenome]|uniref:Uncharacterized protein n=1 Tax=invertebrate metagenome TaxID=1711999 RepID=A0A484H5B9_9ZZZZ